MKALRLSSPFLALAAALGVMVACGSSTSRQEFGDDGGSSSGGFGGDSGGLGEGGSTDIGGRDPVTCEEAQQFKTYVGCDYWPTITANVVEEVFDFAVVVANVGSQTANVKITGPNSTNQSLTVAGGELGIAYLPWVDSLKGPSVDPSSSLPAPSSSVLAKASAFHLVSDVPVVVYQFNPLEFQAKGGPAGKDWSKCVSLSGGPVCYSYSNDASLLLPSTAMTGNYRIMGGHGDTFDQFEGGDEPTYFTVTGTQDGTTVTVKLTGTGSIVGGTGITASSGNSTATFMLDAGDVAEVISPLGAQYDFSGSLLKADKPVQVITGLPCTFIPAGEQACDHVEETVFPVETLGKHYVSMPPSSPKVQAGQWVRFFGNVDGTALKFEGTKPAGCPDFLNAGQVADCNVVADDFEVTGDHEFGIATFMLAGELVDPTNESTPQGDPSQSFAVAVEQFRKSYVFLAPTDYNTNFVDIIAPGGTTLTLDGNDISSKLVAGTNTKYSEARVQLDSGKNGAHSLQASAPIGIQVIGYGDNTTYQYPGGLNLSAISAVPVK